MLQEIKRLQQLEGKYNTLKAFVDEKLEPIQNHLNEVQKMLKELKPTSFGVGTRQRRANLDYVEMKNEALQEMMMNETHIDTAWVEQKFELATTQAGKLMQMLKQENNVETRKEGLRLFLFYHRKGAQ